MPFRCLPYRRQRIVVSLIPANVTVEGYDIKTALQRNVYLVTENAVSPILPMHYSVTKW